MRRTGVLNIVSVGQDRLCPDNNREKQTAHIVITRPEAQDLLRHVGGQDDSDIDLAEAALALAALDRREIATERYRRHLATLAEEVATLVPPDRDSLQARLDALHAVMAERNGYRGDTATYDDIQNLNLMRVIDRRKGLPVALGIIYLQVARERGWNVVGLNFPGHFLIRLEYAGTRAIIDPFNAGLVRNVPDLRDLLKAAAGPDAELTPDHYAPVGNREILLRLQNNLKIRFLNAERPDRALSTIESMLLFAPDEAVLWREAGLLYSHFQNIAAAVQALEKFIALAGHRHPMVGPTALLLQSLRNRLHSS